MLKNKFFCFLIGCLFSTLCHATWTTSQPQPISSTYSYTYSSVFSSCNPNTGEFLATWANGNNNQYPTFSFFSPITGWNAFDTISTSSQAILTTNVLSSCDPQSGQYIATWTDSITFYPTISVYTPGTGWSVIDPLTTSTALANTASSFNSNTGQFLITWADSSNNNYPTFSFFTPNIGWSSIAAITTSSNAANVYTTFDSTGNQFLAVWTDIGTGFPMYSFYSSGTWSPSAPISNLSSVANNVLCSCNPATGLYIATWSDINQSLYPFYSVYTPGSGWSPVDTITTLSGVINNVVITFDPLTGQFLSSWSNFSNGYPTYSFYDPSTGWSPLEVISSVSKTANDVLTSFNSTTGQFLATWGDTSDPDLIFNPTYSFFTNILPPPPPPPPPSPRPRPKPPLPILPQPPSNFTGIVLRNHFLTQTETIHKLEWTAPTNSLLINSYQISRNGVVIANLSASGPYVYYDRSRGKSKKDIYTIVTVTADGRQSAPLTLKL
ncbi:MAG: hypothetical protein Q8K92_13580 [Leadbetterella sp.]|nr:hypothetical protein [Leadbetterella sp.]